MSDATITHSTGTISPRSLTDYRATREAGTVAHPILNREEPDYTLRPFDLRTGSFRLVFGSQTAADAAYAALCTPQPLALASASRPGLNMLFIIPVGGGCDIEPGAAGETIISISGFQEVLS